MKDDVPGWDGERRNDGMLVAKLLSANWVVLPADQRPRLLHCTCCGGEFTTPGNAKLAANTIYPPLT